MDTSPHRYLWQQAGDNLAKESRNSPQLFNSPTRTDFDAIARRKFTSHPVKKYFIRDINSNHIISTTMARLRT
ncbi:hypothetical protein TNCV_3961721 [Trichonephila clavipes]|nr:hypothetical protein TNCV_3961721 [Trichonephila clavipes]